LIPGQSPQFDIILVDSPLVPLARFGLIGVTTLLALLSTLVVGRLRRRAATIPAEALLAFVCMVFAYALLSSPLDDKGVALGLIPLIGLASRDRTDVPDPKRIHA
jgi:O-antigen ligase